MMSTTNFIVSGKANMIIDGQFGSTGKGAIAYRIAIDNHIDLACARLSPNAGHTFYIENTPYVSKLIPIAGIVHKRSTIYICPGSVINTDILLSEIKEFDIDPDRVIIHPRTVVITNDDLLVEQDKNGVVQIASTQSGSGSARASKIMRKQQLAMHIKKLQSFKLMELPIHEYLNSNLNVLIETGQGFDLSINFGYQYPHCTSIDITPSAVLADCGVHPNYCGNIMMTMRTYPIRVGNPIDTDGIQLGYSGDVYDDSTELTCDELNQPKELTTVTKRIRRIFTFSEKEYARALEFIQPTHIFLNFINYIRPDELQLLNSIFRKYKPPTCVGYGPYPMQISNYDELSLTNYLYKYN